MLIEGRFTTRCRPSPCQKAAINNRKNGHTAHVVTRLDERREFRE